MKLIGVIADDLTGAAELGAIGLRHGLHTEIVRDGKLEGLPGLVCLDTDSRSCEPAEAARRVAKAAQRLRQAGAEWIYKKVDSVLRGNVTVEIEAAMKELRFNRALLLPANPSLGRVITNGEYFVHGRPIHRTEFAKDAQYPRRSAQVLRMLSEPRHFLMRLANGELAVPENTLLIGQAETSERVHEWAGVKRTGMLLAGGSELFGAVLAREMPVTDNFAGADIDLGKGLQLFVSGTYSKTAGGLLKVARRAGVPVFRLPKELMWRRNFSEGACEKISQRIVEAFKRGRTVILCVGMPFVRDATAARSLTSYLVDIAETVLKEVQVKNIFAEGGATATELVRRMDWPRLEVRREWMPGVATLAVPGKHTQWLTIKPGSYSWPEQWTKEW